ncbi:MAG: phosphatase PAP2 family protein [Rhizobiaceae bacterium]
MTSVTDLVRGMKDIRLSSAPVLLMAVIAIALYAFFQIADEVSEAEIAQLDNALLLVFRNPADIADPIGPPWLEETVTEITSLGGYPILVAVVAAVAGYLVVVRMFGPALYVVLSVSAGTLLSQVLKSLYDRPRPDIVEHLVVAHTASFPSGHATMSAVVYLTLAALIVRLVDDVRARVYVICVAVLVSVLVGMSRIYLGVHWPSDVAAGWALGVAWACLSWLSVSALRAMRRG